MYRCENCPYATYDKYYKYYGKFDYANQWVLSAFNKGMTDFLNGNADFSAYGQDGTVGMCKKCTLLIVASPSQRLRSHFSRI